MEWTDEALVLAARPHGEGAAVVQLLTRTKGRHAGLFHGGATRRRGLVEPGNRVVATWRARLAEHLGTYTLEAIRHYAAGLMDDPRRLAALAAACAVADGALPEREPHGGVFDAMAVLLEALAAPDDDVWPTVYARRRRLADRLCPLGDPLAGEVVGGRSASVAELTAFWRRVGSIAPDIAVHGRRPLCRRGIRGRGPWP